MRREPVMLLTALWGRNIDDFCAELFDERKKYSELTIVLAEWQGKFYEVGSSMDPMTIRNLFR